MNSIKAISIFAVCCFLAGSVTLQGCRKDDGIPAWPWENGNGGESKPGKPDDGDGEGETKPDSKPVLPSEPLSALADPESAGWKNVTEEYTVSDGIAVYSYTDIFFERPAIAYIAVADASRTGMDIWSINDPALSGTTDALKTPSQVYSAEPASIIVNGGYFYTSGNKNYSASLAVKNGIVLAQNINYASEDWVTMFYPTRAAFVQYENGEYASCWTYFSSSSSELYMYGKPAENSWSSKPLQIPNASFPEKADTQALKNAIGGGPVLLKNGAVIDSYKAELFDGQSGIGPDIYAPRTAIGVSADNKLVLFVCEGREMTEGVTGLTTEEVAKVLYSLGCRDAINLDGGGSSCMLIGGKETIKVSDGHQRAVGSTVSFK